MRARVSGNLYVNGERVPWSTVVHHQETPGAAVALAQEWTAQAARSGAGVQVQEHPNPAISKLAIIAKACNFPIILEIP
jgi:hypothetical protein